MEISSELLLFRKHQKIKASISQRYWEKLNCLYEWLGKVIVVYFLDFSYVIYKIGYCSETLCNRGFWFKDYFAHFLDNEKQ